MKKVTIIIIIILSASIFGKPFYIMEEKLSNACMYFNNNTLKNKVKGETYTLNKIGIINLCEKRIHKPLLREYVYYDSKNIKTKNKVDNYKNYDEKTDLNNCCKDLEELEEKYQNECVYGISEYEELLSYAIITLLKEANYDNAYCSIILEIIDNASLYYNIYSSKKDKYKEKIKDFIEIMQKYYFKCGKDPYFNEVIGIFLVEAKKFKEAIPYLEKAWLKNEKLQSHWIMGVCCEYLAIAYYHSGEKEKAKKLYYQCPPAEPGSSCPHNDCYSNFEDCFKINVINFTNRK